jgi:hypothetical protein
MPIFALDRILRNGTWTKLTLEDLAEEGGHLEEDWTWRVPVPWLDRSYEIAWYVASVLNLVHATRFEIPYRIVSRRAGNKRPRRIYRGQSLWRIDGDELPTWRLVFAEPGTWTDPRRRDARLRGNSRCFKPLFRPDRVVYTKWKITGFGSGNADLDRGAKNDRNYRAARLRQRKEEFRDDINDRIDDLEREAKRLRREGKVQRAASKGKKVERLKDKRTRKLKAFNQKIEKAKDKGTKFQRRCTDY